MPAPYGPLNLIVVKETVSERPVNLTSGLQTQVLDKDGKDGVGSLNLILRSQDQSPVSNGTMTVVWKNM